MGWMVTVEVVDCTSTSTYISGAHITSGTVDLGYTDANGQRILVDLYDYWESVILRIQKSGYIDKNFIIHSSMDGTVQTVCLNPGVVTNGDGDWPDCFIVSATTGSSESEEVNCLRYLRDRVIAVSKLGAELIDAIYHEYHQFSPGIAAELQQDAVAKETVLQSVVRPLIAWYSLAGTLGLDQVDREAASRAAQDVLSACPENLGQSSIVSLLEAIRSGKELPANTPPLLLDLSSRIAHFPFASWAILEPLVRAWRSASEHLDVVDEVAQWLSTAPLEALSPPSDPELLDAELGVLAGFLDFRPEARIQLGERLLAAWPDAAGALERAGFVS